MERPSVAFLSLSGCHGKAREELGDLALIASAFSKQALSSWLF
jgi:hypothetical protein